MLTVAGIGNEYRGDDAIGLRLVEALPPRLLGKPVIFEVWNDPDLLTLANNLLGRQNPLMVIDCMDLGQAPGDYKYFPGGTFQFKSRNFSLTNHGSSLDQALPLAQTQGFNQTVHLFGVQPFELGFSKDLSRGMKDRFEMILRELAEIIIKTC